MILKVKIKFFQNLQHLELENLCPTLNIIHQSDYLKVEASFKSAIQFLLMENNTNDRSYCSQSQLEMVVKYANKINYFKITFENGIEYYYNDEPTSKNAYKFSLIRNGFVTQAHCVDTNLCLNFFNLNHFQHYLEILRKPDLLRFWELNKKTTEKKQTIKEKLKFYELQTKRIKKQLNTMEEKRNNYIEQCWLLSSKIILEELKETISITYSTRLPRIDLFSIENFTIEKFIHFLRPRFRVRLSTYDILLEKEKFLNFARNICRKLGMPNEDIEFLEEENIKIFLISRNYQSIEYTYKGYKENYKRPDYRFILKLWMQQIKYLNRKIEQMEMVKILTLCNFFKTKKDNLIENEIKPLNLLEKENKNRKKKLIYEFNQFENHYLERMNKIYKFFSYYYTPSIKRKKDKYVISDDHTNIYCTNLNMMMNFSFNLAYHLAVNPRILIISTNGLKPLLSQSKCILNNLTKLNRWWTTQTFLFINNLYFLTDEPSVYFVCHKIQISLKQESMDRGGSILDLYYSIKDDDSDNDEDWMTVSRQDAIGPFEEFSD